MDARLWSRVLVFGCVMALFAGGCISAAPPENAVTWGLKAATGRLTETTANEWVALAERVDSYAPTADISLTAEQGQAIVDFLQANDLNTIQEVVMLVEAVANDPNSLQDIEIPDSMLTLFEDANFGSVVDDVSGGS